MAGTRESTKQRLRWTATLATATVFVLGALAACGDDGGTDVPTTTTSAPTSIGPSTSTTTTITTTTRGALPAAVDVVATRTGGGSGEIVLRWNAVANVTGYRVQRSDTSNGPFVVNADLDITTGKATAGSDVINILSQKYSYKPATVAFAPPDSSPWFEYIEIVSGGVNRHYFRVVAYNANGDAPPSAVVCGYPTGRPAC